MSEPKWTPGPWTYAPIPGYQYVVEIRKAEQIFLCAGAVPPGREEEIKANAQLAAAAPDLYAALEHAVAAAKDAYGDCGGYAIDIRECRAALAKARGKA